MPYNQTWLEDTSAIRGVLVEVGVWTPAGDILLYLSNIGYITGDSSISFTPIISGSVTYTESISLDGTATLTFGDIEVSNPNGDYDIWLDSSQYIWVNKPIKIYVGDPSWECLNLAAIKSTFGLVFDGVVADIDSSNRSSLNIKIRDKLERLNTPINEKVLGTYGVWGGGQTNQDTITPLVFGEVFNVTPLLVDPSVIGYMVNDGSINNFGTNNIIEIRDNGVPIHTNNGTTTILSGAAVSLINGTFNMNQRVAGTLTVSVQGVNANINLTTGALITGSYSSNITNIIALIVTQYGVTKLTTTDLDLPADSSGNSLYDFSLSNTQKVGIYLTDRSNILSVCQELASSIGAQLFMSRTGKLQLLKLGSPFVAPNNITSITDRDILHHSLSISNKTEVIFSTKLGYCKNWTVQTGLVTAIPNQHKDIFSKEYIEATVDATDSTIKSKYTLDSAPEQKNTLLISGVDAQAEALRLSNFYSTPRSVFKFMGTSRLLSLTLGQQITLIHNRFNLYNLGNGRVGQVISLSPDWTKSTVEVEVLI